MTSIFRIVVLAFLLAGCSDEHSASLSATSPDSLEASSRWTRIRHIEPRSYVIPFTDSDLEIDGHMNPSEWEHVPWSEEFENILGPDFEPPYAATRFKMQWDSTYLYVAAAMEEEHLWAQVTDQNKAVWRDPDFEIFIDPDGDTHDYFEFEVNLLGTTNQVHFPRAYGDKAKSDRRALFEGLLLGIEFEGTLNYRHDVDSGWTVEMAMPWTSFTRYGTEGKPPSFDQVWRMNLSRVNWKTGPDSLSDGYVKVPDQKKGTNWSWTPQGDIQMHIPEMWGRFYFDHPDRPTTRSVRDPQARDCLLDVYYRQREYFKIMNVWASSLSDLFKELPDVCATIAMVADSSGFIATYEVDMASIDHRRHLSYPATDVMSRDLR